MATNENKTIMNEAEAEVKATATKASTTKQTTKESDLEKQVAAMAEMIKMLQEQINNTKSNAASQPNIIVTAPSTDVTLVYMSDSLGVVMVNNLVLNCTRFGEEFLLSRSDFDAVVGKYRDWFNRGVLAVSSKNLDVAAAKGLKTDKEYVVTEDKLNRLGTMSLTELEKLWNETNAEAEKINIVTSYKRKFIENKEKGYRDRARVDLLNRLTDGGFNREALELSSLDTKYRPIEIDWDK